MSTYVVKGRKNRFQNSSVHKTSFMLKKVEKHREISTKPHATMLIEL